MSAMLHHFAPRRTKPFTSSHLGFPRAGLIRVDQSDQALGPKVKKIIRRIGEEIAADPELGPGPAPAAEVPGRDGGRRWPRGSREVHGEAHQRPYLIRREADKGILKAFAAEGIRFAHRQVTVLSTGPAAGADVARGAGATPVADGSPTAPASS